MTRLSIIVAVANNGVIGNHNQLPWKLRNDLRRFRTLTMGKPLIMGRKTFESIGHPLEGRKTIVITNNPDLKSSSEVAYVHSLEEAIEASQSKSQRNKLRRGSPEAMVIGGASIYAQALPLAKRIYMTWVHADPEGDTIFPAFDIEKSFEQVEIERHDADEDNEFPYTYLTFLRRLT